MDLSLLGAGLSGPFNDGNAPAPEASMSQSEAIPKIFLGMLQGQKEKDKENAACLSLMTLTLSFCV